MLLRVSQTAMSARVWTPFIILALAVPRAEAAPDWLTRLTIEEAIELAQARARAVIRARADVARVDVERARALAQVLPTFDVIVRVAADIDHELITEQRTRDYCGSKGELAGCRHAGLDFYAGPRSDYRQLNGTVDPRFDLVLVARQLLWDGGRWGALIDQAELSAVRSRAILEAVQNNVRLDVARSFYGLESALRTVEALQERVALAEEQLVRAQANSEAQVGGPQDVANARRNLAEDRLALAQRVLAASRRRRALNLVLARSAETPIELVLPAKITTSTVGLRAIRLPSQSHAESVALDKRPDLTAVRARLEIVRRNVTVQAHRMWPRLSVGATYLRRSPHPSRTFSNPFSDYEATLDLDVRWNLFEGFRTRAAIDAAELEVVKSEADVAEVERRVLGEVQDRLESLAVQVQVFRLSQDNLRSAEQAAELSRKLFEQGRSSALELRDAEQKLTAGQLAAMRARLQVEVAREELRRAVGAELLPLD